MNDEMLERNKRNVVAFCNLMFNRCKPTEAISLRTDTYIQHNLYVSDGKQAFIDYFERMAREYPVCAHGRFDCWPLNPLSRMIFFGQASLQHAMRHFMAHYHAERNHQGLGNRLVQPEVAAPSHRHCVQRRQRLGGMLNYYHHAAA